jgi:hypothetical protein
MSQPCPHEMCLGVPREDRHVFQGLLISGSCAASSSCLTLLGS